MMRDLAALVDLNERFERPATRTAYLPVWEDTEIPPWWHSCSRIARLGRAKIIPLPLPTDTGIEEVIGVEWTRQCCPCGNARVMLWINGRWEPYGSWCGDRNAARRDPTFPTRRSAYPDGAPPNTLFF